MRKRALHHKLDVARYYARKHVHKCLKAVADRRFRRRCTAYLKRAAADHDILTGSIFGFRGGVRNHMLALRKYSRFRVGLIPPDEFLQGLFDQDRVRDFQSFVAQQGLNRMRLVHTHAHRWIVRLCAQQTGRRFRWIHTYHTLYFEKDWEEGLEEWQRETNEALIELAPKADVRVSVAKWLQSYLAETHGIESIYIPNGVDVERCDQANGERFRRKTGLDGFVLFASSLRAVKNPRDLVRLAAAMPEESFVMVGDQISEENIRSQLGMDVPANLVLIGQLAHEELLDAIAACKCFVVTSRNEGLPTVLMEAMALCRPCVAPDLDGSQEAVGNGEGGHVYQHDSLEDLVAKTRLALEDGKVGERARERVLREYDWRVVMPKIDALYEEALAQA